MNQRQSNGHLLPEPQVTPKAKRRQYTVEYKLRILSEADAATERGEIGAMLRREGLHSSMLDKWRKQRERGVIEALTPHKRGPKVDAHQVELERLRRENVELQKQLRRAETIIEIQKKLAALLSGGRTEQSGREAGATINRFVAELAEQEGVSNACRLLGIARSRYYRERGKG